MTGSTCSLSWVDWVISDNVSDGDASAVICFLLLPLLFNATATIIGGAGRPEVSIPRRTGMHGYDQGRAAVGEEGMLIAAGLEGVRTGRGRGTTILLEAVLGMVVVAVLAAGMTDARLLRAAVSSI